MNKKGSAVWDNFLHIVLMLLVLGIILGVLYATGILDKLINTVSPKCPVACKAVSSCDIETEYEHGTARCEGKDKNLKCCLKYDDVGGSSGTGAPVNPNGINFEKEGESCTLKGTTINNVYDYKGDCVSKCEYCADNANTKFRKDYCGSKAITLNFACTCDATEKTALETYSSGKVFTGLCPGTGSNALYCCDKKFDKSPPQLAIDASPIPTANIYLASYTVEVSCKDESLNGPGIGCDKNFKYFLLRDNTPITGLKKDCNGLNFQNATKAAFTTDDTQILNITNDTLSSINDRQYVVGEGFKGNLYIVFCAKDKLGNTVIQKSSALPFIAAGSLTNCLKSVLNIVEKRCVNLPVPCFKDNGEKATDPKSAGLLCSGVEFYYDSITACADHQRTMPLCQP
ncbi:MAG: hypothetical protein WC916_07100 [Candidatus Woesearchaeota archaeon]